MKIIFSESTQDAIDAVVTMVTDKISSHPASVIGLATGKTMEPVYEKWSLKKIDMSKAFFFMLDEYVGLPSEHPSTFKSYIRHHFLRPVGLKESQVAFPPIHGEPEHYEQSIRESGGIDLQLLGIGKNGHIGFNEPGSTKDSRTRIVKLTEETKLANADQVENAAFPETALSMGIGTILEAKSLVMLATGSSKADVIRYLVNHHDDPKCPATFLKGHENFTLVLDPAAAAKVNLKI